MMDASWGAAQLPEDVGAASVDAPLLVAGGLATLALLLPFLAVRTAIVGVSRTKGNHAPPRAVETSAPAHRPSVSPRRVPAHAEEAFRRGRAAGSRIRVEDIDELVRALREAELGELRVLRALPHVMLVRVYNCRDCENGEVPPRGCDFEAGVLEGVFSGGAESPVTVHEVACRNQGSSACEFELWI